MKKTLRLLTAFVFALTSIQAAHAQGADYSLIDDIKPPQQAAEFIYRSSPKESLIAVQLMGAVNRPGIYYVPSNTDLLKLLTLAGGNTSNGDISEILVRKLEPKTWAEIQSKAVTEYHGGFEVDAEKIIEFGGARQLKLSQDDFVYVPAKSSWISGEASRTITVISVIMTIALTAILIDKNTDN